MGTTQSLEGKARASTQPPLPPRSSRQTSNRSSFSAPGSPPPVPPRPLHLKPPDGFICHWNPKTYSMLIERRLLAPFFPAITEDTENLEAEECPICFSNFIGGMNRSKCCKIGICTCCYLVVKKTPETNMNCPFCKADNYEVTYSGPKSQDEIEHEKAEKQKVKDLITKMREEEKEADLAREAKKKAQKEQEQQKLLEQAQQNHQNQSSSPVARKMNSVTITPPTVSPSPHTNPIVPKHLLDALENATTEAEHEDAQFQIALWWSTQAESADPKASSSPIPPSYLLNRRERRPSGQYQIPQTSTTPTSNQKVPTMQPPLGFWDFSEEDKDYNFLDDYLHAGSSPEVTFTNHNTNTYQSRASSTSSADTTDPGNASASTKTENNRSNIHGDSVDSMDEFQEI